MSQGWKSIRVFISSTFKDMHAERDYLIKVVFPHLRERLEKHRIELIDIDLRWGITEQQANDGRVLELCLQQVDACRPYFIGLLGQRYGWVPDHIPQNTLQDYEWLQHSTGKSITELEILYGVLKNPNMHNHAFFFFRDPDALKETPDDIVKDVYQEPEPLFAKKLVDLKNKIIKSHHRVTTYSAKWDPDLYDRTRQTNGKLTDLQNFGINVEKQLWLAIKSDHNLEESIHITAQSQEEDLQQRFIESRLRVYVGRDTIHQNLIEYINDPSAKPMMLTGPSGSGKSAILARLSRNFKDQADNLCISHFVGASTQSTGLQSTLTRLCRKIDHAFFLNTKIPKEIIPLINTFKGLLSGLPETKKVVIIIDGVNQFEDADQPQELNWLPEHLRSNVKIILSSINETGHTPRVVERSREHSFPECVVEPLSDTERRAIIQQVPSIAAKTLDEYQIDLLMANPATTIPLYLLIALEELKGFGSFEGLNGHIAQLPHPEEPQYQGKDIVQAIFSQVIDRMEKEFDQELVQHMLCALASVRRGISENELQRIVKNLPGRDDLYPVLRQLHPYLMKKGDLIDFFHRGLWKAVQNKYLKHEKDNQAWHLKMAFFFIGKDQTDFNQGNSKDVPSQYATRLTNPLIGLNTESQAVFEFHQNMRNMSAADDYAEKIPDTQDRSIFTVDPKKITPRLLEELPWQLWQSRSWHYLYELLTDLDFLCSFYFHEEQMCKLYWVEIEKNSHMRLTQAYQPIIRYPAVFEHRMRFDHLKQKFWHPYQVITYLLERSSHHSELRSMLEKMLNESSTENDAHFCTMALRGLYQKMGLIDEALSLQDITTNEKLRPDYQIKANDLCNKAAALAKTGRKEDALQILYEAEKICRNHGLKDLLCLCLLNISHCHIEQDRLEEGMRVLKNLEAISREIGDMASLAFCFGNQGVINRIQGDLNRALVLHQKQRKICEQWVLKDQLPVVTCQTGLILEAMGNDEEALKQYTEAEHISRIESDAYWLAFSLRRQGVIFHTVNAEFINALEKFEECEQIEEQLGNIDALERLLYDEIEILRKIGDYDKISEKQAKLDRLNN